MQTTAAPEVLTKNISNFGRFLQLPKLYKKRFKVEH